MLFDILPLELLSMIGQYNSYVCPIICKNTMYSTFRFNNTLKCGKWTKEIDNITRTCEFYSGELHGSYIKFDDNTSINI